MAVYRVIDWLLCETSLLSDEHGNILDSNNSNIDQGGAAAAGLRAARRPLEPFELLVKRTS